MGVLRLNGKAYGGGIDVIEVTQAQYNALPESKLSDDILYVISDSVNGSDGYPPLIYSTEEREVGVWTDGKPLYAKSFNVGTLPNSTTKNIEHHISNIGDIVDIYGTAQSDGNTQRIPIPFIHNNANNNVRIDATSVYLRIHTQANYDQYYGWATLLYTKSTDTKGSGRWTTQGTLAQHYSTTERLIGTWIDGKPLYQRTWNNLNVFITANTWANTGISATDIDVIVDGTMQDDNKQKIGGTIGFMSSHTYIGVYPQIGNRDLTMLTVQYTKTTD